ncbi:MAG TPA: penicillin-binding transpeptidase domain-containing protein [Acidimicrobiia bacterium]|nr:penicillin-binding transpeptidase domain-containing protein [Acidimicrobiia bacterium]
MNRPTRRLAAAVLVSFALLGLMTTWVQVVAADTYRLDPRNARFNLTQTGKERGLIVSADGVVLARSDPDPATTGSFIRSYPEGAVFANVVGYSSLLFGEQGLERAYSADLRSRRDFTISDLLSVVLGRDLRPENLQLHLDASLQRLAYQALGGQAGAVVALDPLTGSVRALVTSPSYDPAQLVGSDAANQYQVLLEDPARPLSDRATRELYPPGSTFKTVVAAAAIDSGTATQETTYADPAQFPLPGSTAVIENAGRGPCNNGTSTTLLQAFVRSCNTTFARIAIETGAEPIGETAQRIGFNREIPFPWPVAESTFATSVLANDDAALGQSGIGERDVRATPLQMAMVAAAVANQGTVMVPNLVARIFDSDGNEVETIEPSVLDSAFSPETAFVMSQMMERVVTEGTGRQAAVPGIRVAGKTGTSTGIEGRPHAWFIGFAPVDAPTIAVAVFVEAGGNIGENASGGSVAAPIASQLISGWLNR